MCRYFLPDNFDDLSFSSSDQSTASSATLPSASSTPSKNPSLCYSEDSSVASSLLEGDGCVHEDYWSDSDDDFDEGEERSEDENRNDDGNEDETSGECPLPVPSLVIISPPPLRRSTRIRRKPVLFMDEYEKYYKN
jgi:hypothetical protein